MNRGTIRSQIRSLIDQPYEAPQGSFLNTELNDYINVAQVNVQTKLIQFIPWYFRKTKEFSTTANKGEYDISSDIGITDFLLFEEILWNKSGERPQPITGPIDPDQIYDYVKVGGIGEPKIWGYEERGKIFLKKIPDAVYPYKAYYFEEIPDLNHDSSDTSPDVATPHLPKQAHPLISLEAILLCGIKDEEITTDVENKLARKYIEIAWQLSSPQGTVGKARPHLREIVR